MNPNLPCDFSSIARSLVHITFNCRVYEQYISKDELFNKLKQLKLKSIKDIEVRPTGLIVAKEKNTRSAYRAPHKFQIFIKFKENEKVLQEAVYAELVKIITEVQGPFVEIPEEVQDSISDFDSVKEILFSSVKKAADTIRLVTEKDFKCRFAGEIEDSQFSKIFHIYKWASDNKEDRITWEKKMDFIELNKQKWGAEFIWTKLKEFKKIFDDEVPPAPITDYLDYHRIPNPIVTVRSQPLPFVVKLERKDEMSIDLTKDD
jgi:hypothetical protein